MAIFRIIEGQPGQGKSLYMSRLAWQLAERNRKWANKSGVVRKIYANLRWAPHFHRTHGDFLAYWQHPEELVKLRDVDILWDEIATELDSRNFATLPHELKVFLSQYRKRGVDVYANTQDFSMIDLRARLMATSVLTLKKLVGSRDPSPTRPPIKHLWGLITAWNVENWREADPQKKRYSIFPHDLFFIEKEDVERYDTRQAIEAGILPDKKLRKFTEVYEGDDETAPFKRVKYF